jgi:hypothetical protein
MASVDQTRMQDSVIAPTLLFFQPKGTRIPGQEGRRPVIVQALSETDGRKRLVWCFDVVGVPCAVVPDQPNSDRRRHDDAPLLDRLRVQPDLPLQHANRPAPVHLHVPSVCIRWVPAYLSARGCSGLHGEGHEVVPHDHRGRGQHWGLLPELYISGLRWIVDPASHLREVPFRRTGK